MGPPSISQYSHHASSISNETYQMMNGYDFLNPSTHHQSSFSNSFQHSPFNNQPQAFNSNHMHFNQNQEYPPTKHLNDPSTEILLKPPSSPPHMESNGNNWQYAQSQQYSLSSLCQAASVPAPPTNIPLDYHQSYPPNSNAKYWS